VLPVEQDTVVELSLFSVILLVQEHLEQEEQDLIVLQCLLLLSYTWEIKPLEELE
jgi:hypothetical protein